MTPACLDAKAGGGSDDAGATGTVQYFTTSCSTLVSGVYYAEQAVNDSKGNPVPAATILQVVSASLLYSSPINAPNSSYTIGSGASEMFAKDGFAATYCGSAAGQQALFTVRPQ